MTLAATHQAMPAKLDRDQWTAGDLPFPAGCFWPISDGHGLQTISGGLQFVNSVLGAGRPC